MPKIDPATLSPKARTAYITLGRQYGSSDTIAQANQTLKGLATHGAELVQDGFGDEDRQHLQDARDDLLELGGEREDARGDKKVTATALHAAIAAGKDLRKSARAILLAARRVLHEKDDAAAEAGVSRIDAALAQTRSLDDEDKLPSQLDTLRGVLGDPSVAPEAAKRGGAKAASGLQAAAGAIRAAAAANAGAPGTRAETEALDLRDGIIVTLARGALRAAKAAAKRLGQPSLTADFELSKLHPAHHPASATTNNTPAPTTSTPVNGTAAPTP